MTKLVATATGETPDELYERCRVAARTADWVEVRLDGPSGLPWDLRPYFALDKPAIATMRHVDDGGRSHADDGARADVLRRALRAGARAIDVELHSSFAKLLVDDAHDAGALAIVSHHDLEGTPSAEAILAWLREARTLRADVAKVATTLKGPADAASLVDAATLARLEGIPFALMAVNDPFLRLLAPALGMALAYGAPPGRPPATPGQVAIDKLRATHATFPPAPSGRTRVAFLLGHPVAHSKSPAMHDAAFRALGLDARYLALDVPPARLAAAMDALRGAMGLNLTVPHKEAALALMDELHESAKASGAVNTVQIVNGRRIGHDTDGQGALDALREADVTVRGARVVLLGAGGAARAVASALLREGATVAIANRTATRASTLASTLGATLVPWEDASAAIARADLVVNATTLGLHDEDVPVALPKGIALLDCVYREGGTPLTKRARAQGLRVVAGEAMLLHQGARAFRIWTGREPPLAAMRSALGVGF